MNVLLPEKELLKKTGDVDYFDWNYRFPHKYYTCKVRSSIQFCRFIPVKNQGKNLEIPDHWLPEN